MQYSVTMVVYGTLIVLVIFPKCRFFLKLSDAFLNGIHKCLAYVDGYVHMARGGKDPFAYNQLAPIAK